MTVRSFGHNSGLRYDAECVFCTPYGIFDWTCGIVLPKRALHRSPETSSRGFGQMCRRPKNKGYANGCATKQGLNVAPQQPPRTRCVDTCKPKRMPKLRRAEAATPRLCSLRALQRCRDHRPDGRYRPGRRRGLNRTRMAIGGAI